MHALAGPFLAAAALLVLAGAAKVLDPAPLVRALRSLGLPGGPLVVRLAAAAEVVVGVAALLTGSRAAALAVAASYALFTAVVVRGLLRGGVLASCGCFGKADTPPTRTHAVVTAGLAAVALAVDPPTPGALTLPLLVASAAVAVTAYLALAVLPLLHAPVARRPG
ncbi:MAG: hypothetical protein JWO60_2757 [Frankiales bacterium]|nr:hypothetical protein [Frankiales bacterium]